MDSTAMIYRGEFEKVATNGKSGVLFIHNYNYMPFVPVRSWLISGMNSERGGHAHKETNQLITPVVGSIVCFLSDYTTTKAFGLRVGSWLVIPKMVWCTFTPARKGEEVSVLACADKPYDADDYICDLDEYLKMCEVRNG